jgi:membrane fusion protein, multidrug efflux system
MKFLLSVVFMTLCAGFLYAGNTVVPAAGTPIIAQMNSMVEGQIVYEVALGAHVKKGQLVEAIDTTACHAQVMSDLAEVDYVQQLYVASKTLIKTHSISMKDFLGSKRDYAVAVEKYVVDRNTEKHCKIYAPFDGVVTSITTYPGSGIGDGNLIMTIQKTA